MTTATELNVFDCPLDGINQIEASAGTGKTWNMCGLYLRLLLERQLPVQQILVVTFTKAATAELRERIRSRIADTLRFLALDANAIPAAAPDPFITTLVGALQERGISRDAMIDRLKLALQSFDEASIFTIHGFCQRALADAPFAAAMPFSTDLQQGDEELALRAVQEVWRKHISSGKLPTDLTNYLLERRDSPESFARLLKRQLAKTQSVTIWPENIDPPDNTGTPFTSHLPGIEQAFRDAADCWAASADEIRTLLHDSLPALNGATYKAASIDQACKEWRAHIRLGDPMAMPDPRKSRLALLTASRLTTGTKKNNTTPTHPFFDIADTLLTLRNGAGQDLDLARLRLLRDLFAEGAGNLARLKRELRIQSYDDILYNVFAALQSPTTPWLAGALLARYPAALIDEFQDTDPLQFAIFDAIYGGGANPLFFVGDPKQAIYSFRNADLQTYLRARDKATAHYSLAENQRSSAGLIAAQNALFSANPAAFLLPGLTYQPVRAGKKPRTSFVDRSVAPDNPTSPLQLWELPRAADGSWLSSSAAKAAACRATAAEIARLLHAAQDDKVLLGERALQAGDIAVLVKSHAQGSAIRNALSALGIGSVELSQASIFDSIDAEDIERVLQAILAPTRTDMLLTALSTELLGIDAAAIASMASDEVALQTRIEQFDGYRTLWRERGVGFMVRRLFSDEGVSKRMLARADGERRMTNLLHLGEYLHQAGHDHPAPDALLRWLNAQRRHAIGDDAAQLRLESDQNLVQIVTIHRSKGLEYPVVFCPFLWPGRLAAGSKIEGREYHDANGKPVIDFREEPDDLESIKASIKQDGSAEFLRLMYVALTRAAHRCYLVVGNYAVGKSTTESGRSQLNWLVAGASETPETWPASRLSPEHISTAWAALAASNAPHIGIATLPQTPGTPVRFARPDADSLHAQTLPPMLRDGWRMTSFSALQHATANENAGTDHDMRSNWSTYRSDDAPADLPADDILRFARGASAGDTLHAVLEHIDFADPDSWDRTIRHGLSTHPQILDGVASDEQLPLQSRMVRNLLDQMTTIELTTGVRLSTLQPGSWLSELEFNLPAPRLQAETLNTLLAEAGYSVAPLAFRRMEGYLKGYIDLVFEADGRYYLLDWKSNHLGYRPEDYATDGIAAAMAEHGYHLQYLLYALALHRYLGQRLPGYDYDTHFGGVLYLFVRGVRPDWRNPDDQPAGVYFHRPPIGVINTLDALFHAPTIRSAA